MKATGIVRRIDDLGRIVIPKEIRRTLRIREGDPLEIYTESNGEVVFKKYSHVGELNQFVSSYADVLSNVAKVPVLITDMDHVVAVSGISKKELLNKKISSELEKLLEDRVYFEYAASDSEQLAPIEGIDVEALVMCPIISDGNINGAVILLKNETTTEANVLEIKLTQAAAIFLAKQME